jgi:membrane protein
MLPGGTILWQGVELVVSFAFITVLFAVIFKFLPDAQIAWQDVWVGAMMTALLFTLGKFLIGLYLGRSGVASTYGAAGSLVLVLLWFYYSALIVFFGAEFTQVYANSYGKGIQPNVNAEVVKDKAQLARPEYRNNV